MDPIEIVQHVYDSFASGDVDGALSRCAPDVVVTQDPAVPWGGRYVGHDGVLAFAGTLFGTIESTVVPEALFAAGDVVVQHGRTVGTVRSSGVAFDIPECHIWTLRDGVVVQADFYIDSAAMLEALAA